MTATSESSTVTVDPPPEPHATPQRSWVWRVAMYGLALLSLLIIFGSSSNMGVGGGVILMMLVLLALKTPIAITMLLPSALGLIVMYGFETATELVGHTAYAEAASWSLSVVPMFIFMGLMLWRSGMTTDLFAAMTIVFNRVPASLAVGTNMAGGGLAAVSGSTVGVTYALARIGVPEMLKAGYDKRMATSSVLMAGLAGQLIPPSILLVIYAGLASVPVGHQLLAGVVPGIFLVLTQCLALIAMAMVWPRLVGGRDHAISRQRAVAKIPASEKVQAIIRVWPVPVITLIVLGGMFTGTLTATEAGAAGALAALLLTVVKKRREAIGMIKVAVLEAATATATVLFLLMGAAVISLVMSDTGLASALATWVLDSGFTRVQFLLIILVAYLLLGMIGETLVAMMLTVPILLPLFDTLGIDALWFGVFAVLCVELGMVLPPVGILVYVVHGIAQDPEVNMGEKITLKDAFTGVGWLLPISLFVIAVMIAFPEMATWLPNRGSIE